MGRSHLPPDLLRVPFKGRLTLANRSWLEAQVAKGATSMTEPLELALLHLRKCRDAFTLELPAPEPKPALVNARIDPSHVAWMADMVRSRRVASISAAVDYAVTHARHCKAKVASLKPTRPLA